MSKVKSQIPEVTDLDIEWIQESMNLDLDEERVAFLKCNESISLNACPGSGKTTLIIAKIAILLKKWPYQTRGLCVLSHTNVAREEIERRLGHTTEGRDLLKYPHFVGTIHSFVSKFLTIPFLKSFGIDNITVDTKLTSKSRKKNLGKDFYKIQSILTKYHINFEWLQVTSWKPFHFLFEEKEFPNMRKNHYSQLIKSACIKTLNSGFLTYEDLFVIANILMEKQENIQNIIKYRFPFVLIDEAQDTGKTQWDILNKIFTRDEKYTFQAIGDINQAIYNNVHNTENTTSFLDVFENSLSISKSFRFCNNIAQLATPCTTLQVALEGIGPQMCQEEITPENTIYIFPKDDTSKVLSTFGELLLNTFPDEYLWGRHKIFAVGSVHRQKEESFNQKHFPKSLVHYWSDYHSDSFTKKSYHPNTLSAYFFMAKKIFRHEKNSLMALNTIAAGVCKLLSMTAEIEKTPPSSHSYLSNLLSSGDLLSDTLSSYKRICLEFFYSSQNFDEQYWEVIKTDLFLFLCPEILHSDKLTLNDVKTFLAYEANLPGQNDSFLNVYTHTSNSRNVEINLGSIHSVKGQTHLATLVLDTYYNTHFFKKLLPIIATGKIAKGQEKRMRQCFVAMTRPTHLLCLAVADSSLPSSTTWNKIKVSLQNLGWKIVIL